MSAAVKTERKLARPQRGRMPIRPGLFVWVMFLTAPFLLAQEPKQSSGTVVTVDSMFSSYPKLEAQAKEIGEAFVRKDFQRFVELTHPKLIQLAGGTQKFLAALADEAKQEEGQGLEVLSSTPTDPIQFLKVSGGLYAVMPTAQRMKMRGKLFEAYGCLVGVSNDRGEHWTFLEFPPKGLADMLPLVANKLAACPEKRPVQLSNDNAR